MAGLWSRLERPASVWMAGLGVLVVEGEAGAAFAGAELHGEGEREREIGETYGLGPFRKWRHPTPVAVAARPPPE